MLEKQLVDMMIFALEDQSSDYYLDLNNQLLLREDELDDEDILEKTASLCLLPDWRPVDGYNLMKGFALALAEGDTKQKLLDVLEAGKGVFRGFKNALDTDQHSWRKWLSYKEEHMHNYIQTWYAELKAEEELDNNVDYRPELNAEDFYLSELIKIQEIEEFLAKEAAFFISDSKDQQDKLLDLLFGKLMDDPDTQNRLLLCRTAAEESAGFCEILIFQLDHNKSAYIKEFSIHPSYKGLFLEDFLFNQILKFLLKEKVDQLYLGSSADKEKNGNSSYPHKPAIKLIEIRKIN